MSSFPARFYLRRDEKVLVEQAITPAWALEQAIAWFLLGAVLFGGPVVLVLLRKELPGRAEIVFGIAATFIVYWLTMLLYTWRRVATSEYVVTEEAVYTRRGRLLLSVDVATLDRVTDLHVHTSVVGRLLGYSRLVVKTAGGGLVMSGVRDAYGIRGTVHDARQRLLARLLREGGRTEARTAASRPQIDIECPSCRTAFAAAGTPPLDVRCPRCQATGTLFPEALA